MRAVWDTVAEDPRQASVRLDELDARESFLSHGDPRANVHWSRVVEEASEQKEQTTSVRGAWLVGKLIPWGSRDLLAGPRPEVADLGDGLQQRQAVAEVERHGLAAPRRGGGPVAAVGEDEVVRLGQEQVLQEEADWFAEEEEAMLRAAVARWPSEVASVQVQSYLWRRCGSVRRGTPRRRRDTEPH